MHSVNEPLDTFFSVKLRFCFVNDGYDFLFMAMFSYLWPALQPY